MFKSIDKWLPGYLASMFHRPRAWLRPRHLIFCVADHFEPFRGRTDQAAARMAVREWIAAYPGALESFQDIDGYPPRHTFFYPAEEYDPDCLDRLAGFGRRGLGEVEIQLHHRQDTAEGLKQKLETFRDLLRTQHGLLGEPTQGADDRSLIRYAFVHGNWALCNSRPDGDWCGVNEELAILRNTGCYADFTFPSAPSPTQPRTINAIYRAVDTPGRPRGCDYGQEVSVARTQIAAQIAAMERGSHIEELECASLKVGAALRRGDPDASHSHTPTLPYSDTSLMLVTGPLALNWRHRKWGLLPRLENGEITGANPPSPERIALWARQAIHVRGRPEWVFVKAYTHGCVPENRAVLLGAAMREAHAFLQARFNDGVHWQLHYVAAREMYNIIRAAEAGKAGNPGAYRDYEIQPPRGK